MHGRIEAGEIKRRRGNNLRKLKNATRKVWRRGSESNRRVKVLQTSPLPLGYRAPTPYVSVLEEKSPSAEEQPGHKKIWSGRRGSNPRHRPWQGRALPLSYSRSFSHSTALAHFVTIHCTRTGTRFSSFGSSPSAAVLRFGRKRSTN